MQLFLENCHFKNQASVALNPFVSLLGHFVTRGGKKSGNGRTDGRTDKQSTVTLAAHARRGLIITRLTYQTQCSAAQCVASISSLTMVLSIITALKVVNCENRRDFTAVSVAPDSDVRRSIE